LYSARYLFLSPTWPAATPQHITRYRTTLHHSTPHHTTPCHTTPRHITSHRTTSPLLPTTCAVRALLPPRAPRPPHLVRHNTRASTPAHHYPRLNIRATAPAPHYPRPNTRLTPHPRIFALPHFRTPACNPTLPRTPPHSSTPVLPRPFRHPLPRPFCHTLPHPFCHPLPLHPLTLSVSLFLPFLSLSLSVPLEL
jgi:hypothetical protein